MAYVAYIIKDSSGVPHDHKYTFDTTEELMQQIDVTLFLNVNEMADYVLSSLSKDEIEQLKVFPFKDLISLHHTVGQDIRNYFGLWVEGNPNVTSHPDDTSMEVLELVWKKVQDGNSASQVMTF